MRTNAFSATGHHLREDAVNGVGMHERHLEPVQAAPWTLVDQSSACHRQLAKNRFDVVRLERDVVHAGTAPREEATHGSVVPGRGEQLDATLAEQQSGSLDPLLLELVAVLDLRAEESLVRRDRLVEIGNGHADMVDAVQGHAAMLPAGQVTTCH